MRGNMLVLAAMGLTLVACKEDPQTTVGTRIPPSQAEPFPPFSGPLRMKPPPLSDVKIT